MTEPLDIDEIRAQLRKHGDLPKLTCLAMVDEIDRLREDNADLAMIIERLGKPVVNAYRWEDVKRFTDAEAKLAAVRALCRREARWTEQGFGWITVDDVLALIDEENNRD